MCVCVCVCVCVFREYISLTFLFLFQDEENIAFEKVCPEMTAEDFEKFIEPIVMEYYEHGESKDVLVSDVICFQFIFFSYKYCMDLCDQLCLAGWLSYLMNILPDITRYFQPNIYIPVMPMGTIDFYHFYLFQWSWVWLGVTGSEKSETFWLHFQLIGMKFDVELKQF